MEDQGTLWRAAPHSKPQGLLAALLGCLTKTIKEVKCNHTDTTIDFTIKLNKEAAGGRVARVRGRKLWGGDAKKAGILRALITEDSHQLNKKYGNLVTQRTFNDIVMASITTG